MSTLMPTAKGGWAALGTATHAVCGGRIERRNRPRSAGGRRGRRGHGGDGCLRGGGGGAPTLCGGPAAVELGVVLHVCVYPAVGGALPAYLVLLVAQPTARVGATPAPWAALTVVLSAATAWRMALVVFLWTRAGVAFL